MGRTGRPRSAAAAEAGDRLAGPAAGSGAGQDNTLGIPVRDGFPAAAGSSPKSKRSGLRGLAEGQKISYELQADRRTGKESAANLKRPDLTWIKARAKRGHIIVRDRARLEEAAGGSYGVPEQEYRRLFGQL